MHPSATNKIFTFDKHKLLHIQIDTLTEVLDRRTTRPQGRQIQQSRPYKPYIHRDRRRCYRQIPSYDRGRENYRKL